MCCVTGSTVVQCMYCTKCVVLQVLQLCKESESHVIDRSKLEDLLKQRFFYDQAFSIYQGVAGLFDYGPMGCAMKANLLTAWRHFFVLEEQMLEVDSCMLTPEIVLKLVSYVSFLIAGHFIKIFLLKVFPVVTQISLLICKSFLLVDCKLVSE